METSHTIQSAAALVGSGKLKARALLDEYLLRAERENPRINAYLRLLPEGARAQADEIDRRVAAGETVGALAGVPVAVKDNMNLRGVEISAGSRILEGFHPPFTATAVERLLAADAVVIGVANMDEFAMGSSTENSAYCQTRNPRDPERVPGGSSGGSAAAVAAGLALGALGSDTGGSIRLPASFCGVVGLKPTYGRVSRYGLIAYASSLDQIGPFADNVADAALLYQAIAGFDEHDSTSLNEPLSDPLEHLDDDIAGLRVGVPAEFFGEGFDADVRGQVLRAISILESQGALIVPISLPMLDYSLACYYLIACAEASSNLERYDGVRFGQSSAVQETLHEMMQATRSGGFGREVQRRIILGTYILSAGYYDAYYLKAQRVRTLIQRDFARAFGQVDIIAGPVSPVPPFRLGERADDPLAMYLTDVATVSANLAGIPALSVPCGETGAGLPVGLQLMGPALGENRLLNVAHRFEQARGEEAEPYAIEPRALGSLQTRAAGERIEIPIERIAELAALRADPEAARELREDVAEIIGYVDLLKDVDTAGIDPTTHPVACRPFQRDGAARRFDAIDDILAGAPEREGSAFKIPNIM